MAFALTWLPEVLEDAGLKVAEQPGWRTRGRGEMGTVRGVMCHHTAGAAQGIMPSLGLITNGRPDLAGPLAQLGLGRDGTFFVVAAGRCNHAGAGLWQGLRTGNSNFIGIEAENTGRPNDPWPAVQMDAYRRGVAAILKKVGADAIMCCGHKEYALPHGRKNDPTFDMVDFRTQVAHILGGTAPAPAVIPKVDAEGRPTLRRGARGDLVAQLQTGLKLPADGLFGPGTEAALRQFQRDHGLVPDGIVGPRTWALLGKPAG
jgi:peptidoglycan hydrolase-like protein with peptidoglycan-binding domain